MRNLIIDFYDRAWAHRKVDQPVAQEGNWQDLAVTRLAVKFGHPHTILDIGCGIGDTLQKLSTIPSVKKLIGIEPSAFAVKEAKRRLPYCEIYQGVAEDMSQIPDESCDIVTAVSVMEHVYDTHRVLNEINRVLKPSGIVSIYTTDFNLLKKILVALFAFEKCFEVCGGHIRFFSKKSLREVMVKHGFELAYHDWSATYFGIMPHGQNAVYRKVKDEHILETPSGV